MPALPLRKVERRSEARRARLKWVVRPASEGSRAAGNESRRSFRRPSGVDDLLAFGLALLIFYPRVISFVHSLLTPTVLLLTVIWISCDRRVMERSSYLRSACLAAYAALGVVFCRMYQHTASIAASVTLERFAVVLPLSAMVGWALVRTGKLALYLRWQVAVGVLTVPLAMFEWLAGTDIFHAGGAFARNGNNRAVVATEHPLVLATLFVSLISIAIWLIPGVWGYIAAGGLYLGVWTTGSNGPEIVGGLLLALLVARPVARRFLSSWRGPTVFLVGLIAYMTIGIFLLWSAQIHGTTTTEVSNGYREALYYLAPKILHTKPFGYGLGGLPTNRWYVGTQVSGIRDITRSIDSELVLAVANFGYLALAGYIATAFVGALAAVRHFAVGLSSLAVTLVGLFLALDSWTSLGCAWFVGAGASAALLFRAGDWNRLESSATPRADIQGRSFGVTR